MRNKLFGLQENVILQYVVTDQMLESILTDIIEEYLTKREEENKKSLLSSTEVSKTLGVNKSTLWRWEKERYLIPIRIGNKIRYKKTDVDAILEER